ncbi:hypothetical protein [Gilvibacter sediminis]|uniref:hypothetical protein n=1 Tax=Gilvibacter sediminis TaxID=379071 RepID=UPI002350B807|nr:hypothetical protein [Gilvibacter sediminis]MDC7996904.1 hypothetical protein [Gilvibacter sediminis]
MSKAVSNQSKGKIVFGFPILVIDDKKREIETMKDDVSGLKELDYLIDNVFFFQDQVKYEAACQKYQEAILIADFSMERHGIDLLNYIVRIFPEHVYHLFIYTGEGGHFQLKDKINEFNGSIFDKSSGLDQVLLDIQDLMEPYFKGKQSGLESINSKESPKILINEGPKRDDIIRLIDQELEILSKTKGGYNFDGKDYSYNELRKEINTPDSEVGRAFIETYIHGMIMHNNFLRRFK